MDGDYRNPPPKGKYDKLHEYSKRLMKRDPVHVERELRIIVLEEFALRLWQESSEVIVGSFDDHHLHILHRAEQHNPRHLIGGREAPHIALAPTAWVARGTRRHLGKEIESNSD